jgi:hypothetical protein
MRVLCEGVQGDDLRDGEAPEGEEREGGPSRHQDFGCLDRELSELCRETDPIHHSQQARELSQLDLE